jgi:hypothetical protein
METQITFEDSVVNKDNTASIVKLQCNKHGCIIFYHNILEDKYTSCAMSWEQMLDLEHISEAFADTSVRMFRVICNLLDKAHSCKHAYI